MRSSVPIRVHLGSAWIGVHPCRIASSYLFSFALLTGSCRCRRRQLSEGEWTGPENSPNVCRTTCNVHVQQLSPYLPRRAGVHREQRQNDGLTSPSQRGDIPAALCPPSADEGLDHRSSLPLENNCQRTCRIAVTAIQLHLSE